jgi:hypothetical protein
MLRIGRVHTADGAKVSRRGGGLSPGCTVIAGGRPPPRHLVCVSAMGTFMVVPDVTESHFKLRLHRHLHPNDPTNWHQAPSRVCSCLWDLASVRLLIAAVIAKIGTVV